MPEVLRDQSNAGRPVFLSYARSDEENVARIEAALKATGVPVFRDSELRAGATWDIDLVDAIGRSSVVVLCWSRDSQDSFYVRREGQVALAKNIPFVNVALEPAIIPLDFAHQQAFRFDNEATLPAQWEVFVERVTTLAAVGADPSIVRRVVPEMRARSTGYVGWWFDVIKKKDYENFLESWSGTARFWIAAFCIYLYAEHVIVGEFKRVLKASLLPKSLISCGSKETEFFKSFCQKAKGEPVVPQEYWLSFVVIAGALWGTMLVVRRIAWLSVGRRRINYVIGFVGGCAIAFWLLSTVPGSFSTRF